MTRGIFEPKEDGEQHIILLDATKGRWNFPELKTIAIEQNEYWEPKPTYLTQYLFYPMY